MKIIIHRTNINPLVTLGTLSIGAKTVCYTLERTQIMLPVGEYELYPGHQPLTHGNGAYRLEKPYIIVGEYRCDDLLIHSFDTYCRLFARIRKAWQQHRKVILSIEE